MEHKEKHYDLAYCLDHMGLRKRIQSRYCKLRSQGTWREASKVFRRGQKEGWFRLRARQFTGNDSFPGPSFKGSRQQHFDCQGQRVCQQSLSPRRESSLPTWTGLWQTSSCIKGTNHWRWSEDEELLWSKGLLGSQSTKSLIATVWFVLTQHFGLRGCQEHHDMYVEDFSFSKDDNGVEYVTYEENLTKTRHGGLRKKRRVVEPKMFATGGPRCPVKLLKTFLSHRPEEMKSNEPFYASVNSSCALSPSPGNCGAFARLVSPGGGALANLARPGARALANPGDGPEKFVEVFKGMFC